MATLEVDIADDASPNAVCAAIHSLMHDEFGIEHTTVQTHAGQRGTEDDSHCTFD